MNSKELACLARFASEEKQGIDPVLLDLRKLTDIADFFLLVHGTSDRHVRALADQVVEFLGGKKVWPLHVEGMKDATWVLIDYGAVIVQVFRHDTRKFYNLERLWGDAKIVEARKKHEKRIKRTRRSLTA